MKMRDQDENGWATSAPAWINRMGNQGDFSREFVLDKPMLERVAILSPKTALDVGCGEGRFCRKMSAIGVSTTGLDPVQLMIDEAISKDGQGTYCTSFAEKLPFADETFELVVTYLSLIDIDDAEAAISEMYRVLKPGGHILVANLTSFSTSSAVIGRRHCRETGEELRPLGRYLEERNDWFEWDGLRIRNWHRPLSKYMQWFLQHELVLTHFDEPRPVCAPADQTEAYENLPYLMMMEWRKRA